MTKFALTSSFCGTRKLVEKFFEEASENAFKTVELSITPGHFKGTPEEVKLVKKIIVQFALFKNGIDFEALDNKVVSFVFLILAPATDSPKYLKVLAYMSRVMNRKETRKALLEASTKKEILKILKRGY